MAQPNTKRAWNCVVTWTDAVDFPRANQVCFVAKSLKEQNTLSELVAFIIAYEELSAGDITKINETAQLASMTLLGVAVVK